MKGISKISLAIAMAGYGLSANAAIEDPSHINWGVVEVTPVAKLSVGHDDNIFRNGDATSGLKDKGSNVVALDASADFKAQQGLNTYSMKLAATNKTFTSEHDADFTNLGMNAAVHQELNSRNRLDLNVGYGRYHDEGSTVNGANDKSAPEYDRTNGKLVYGFGSKAAMFRTDLFGNYDKKEYNTAGEDNKTTELGGTAYYRVLPKTDALVEINQRTLDYSNESDAGYDVTSYLAGVSWDATAKTTGYAKLGRRYRDSKKQGVDTEGFTGWEVGVSYLPLEHSLIQLSTTRDYGLESDDPLNRLFTQGSTSQISWQHGWTTRISTKVSYSYTDNEIQDDSSVSIKDRTVHNLGLSVQWQLRRYATLALSWNNIDRDETVTEAGAAINETADSYGRNVYMLTAEMSL